MRFKIGDKMWSVVLDARPFEGMGWRVNVGIRRKVCVGIETRGDREMIYSFYNNFSRDGFKCDINDDETMSDRNLYLTKEEAIRAGKRIGKEREEVLMREQIAGLRDQVSIYASQLGVSEKNLKMAEETHEKMIRGEIQQEVTELEDITDKEGFVAWGGEIDIKRESGLKEEKMSTTSD